MERMTDKEKAKRREKILKGIPYTEKGLKALHFTELSILLGALKINPFKMKDKSIAGKIKKILRHQEEYEPPKKSKK